MATKIRGITIELGADTSKFEKSFNDVNKSLKSTQKDLRDVNKLLKLDPSNVELLKEKQTLLKTSVDETKEKLKLLKSAYADLKGADNSAETTEQQKALKEEIARTEANLKGLQKESKEFGSAFGQVLKQAGEKVDQFGQKISGVGEGLTKNVTAPIVAVGTASLVAFNEVDKGMDIIVKKTGATGETLDSFVDIAKNIATEYPVAFDKVGEAVGEVNTRFGSTGEELATLSEQFVMFAEINDTNVTTSVDNVQKAMSSYGLSVSDTSGFLDLLTVVAQNTGVSVDKLETGLVQNATAFQEMGLSVEDAVNLMGQLEKSGSNSETVMNGLRKALKTSAKEGKPLNKVLEDLEDNILNSTDATEGLNEAYEIFGKSGDQIYGAIKSGTLSFKELGKTSLDTGGKVKSTFQQTKSPAESFQTILNQLKVLGYDIANALMPTIQKVIEKVTPVIEKLITAWEGLDEPMQQMIITGALVVSAIGPIVTVVGKLVSGFGKVLKVGGSIVSFVAGLNPTVVLITGAIALVIASGVALYKNWKTIREKLALLWDKVKTVFNAIKEKIDGVWTAVSDTATTVWTTITTTLSTAWDGIKTTASTVWTSIKDAVTGAWDSLKTSASTVFETIKKTITDKFDAVKTSISNVWTSVKDTLQSILDKVKGIFSIDNWTIPKLKLPHFKVEGKFGWSWEGGLTYPKLTVEWYKKAMSGMILKTPTIFGMNNGRLMGGGDGGSETIVGTNNLMSMIRRATAEGGVNYGGVNVVINVDNEITGRRLLDEIETELANRSIRRKAVFG